jgi:signal transduction histidine kinase
VDVYAWPLIAWSRFVLAVFALVAIYADPVQPARHSQFAYYLLVALVVYSGFLALANSWTVNRRYVSLLVHTVDIMVFGVLIFLTDGATSPFFIFFTFAMFSATLTWNWQGAVITTLATVAIYGFLTANSELETGLDITRTIVRNAYLVVAGVLFAYFGAILSSQHSRLAKLAAWPAASPTNTDMPDLSPTFAHIAEVTGIANILAVWENPFEPHLFVCEYSDREFQTRTLARSLPEVLKSLTQTQSAEPVRPAIIQSKEPLPVWLSIGCNMPFKVITPIGLTTFSGYLVVCSSRSPSEDIMALIGVTAAQVSSEIEQHYLRRRLTQLAVLEGRNQLARDIHDGLLQAMAAIALQLKTLEKGLSAEKVSKIEFLRATLNDQQAKLRSTIAADREGTKPRQTLVPLQTDLQRHLSDLERKWNCAITLSVLPDNASVKQSLIDTLKFFIAEGVANGVRHGSAAQFVVALRRSPAELTLNLKDDGRGLPEWYGDFDHGEVFQLGVGSASLRQRAEILAGKLGISSSEEGVEISLKVPLE